MADDFLPTMTALLDRPSPPDHIIIETSGLALPKPLVKAFQWPDIRTRATVDGVVALIVKMDDVGLSLIEGGKSEKFGRFLVNLMPKVMAFLSTVGVVAMLWVGGHILLVGTDELGFHPLYSAVHHVEEAVHAATGAPGGVLGWLTNTVASGIFGLIVGTIVALIVTPILAARAKSKGEAPAH